MNKQLVSLAKIKKAKVKYKRVGARYQADSLLFSSPTCAKKYLLDQGYSLLHSQVKFMTDRLKLKNHSLFMDDLYMSALFAFRVLECEKR